MYQDSFEHAPLSPRLALLGYAGLIPFITLTLAIASGVGPINGVPLIDALIAYAAIILSFMGAIWWGLALTLDAQALRSELASLAVIPALFGWLALLLPHTAALVILALAFLLLLFKDRRIAQQRLTADSYGRRYLQMRSRLTTVVVLCLALSAFAEPPSL